jgi:hypothetical protein
VRGTIHALLFAFFYAWALYGVACVVFGEGWRAFWLFPLGFAATCAVVFLAGATIAWGDWLSRRP